MKEDQTECLQSNKKFKNLELLLKYYELKAKISIKRRIEKVVEEYTNKKTEDFFKNVPLLVSDAFTAPELGSICIPQINVIQKDIDIEEFKFLMSNSSINSSITFVPDKITIECEDILKRKHFMKVTNDTIDFIKKVGIKENIKGEEYFLINNVKIKI